MSISSSGQIWYDGSMRRLLVCLVVSLLVAVGLTAAATPSYAALAITGRLVDATTGEPVSGVTVRLRMPAADGPAPGGVFDTDTTGASGAFSLEGPAHGRFYVQVVPGRYQSGYVGGHPRYAQPGLDDAGSFESGTKLGKVRVNPAFITGVVVDAVTKDPVRGAKVSARTFSDPNEVEATDSTDRAGRFRLTGITFEDDGYLKINGSGVGHETGYVACSLAVVESFENACASPLGVITGKIRLESLPGAPRLAPDARPVKPGRIGKTKAGMTVSQAFATGEFVKFVPNPPCDPIRLQPTGAWKDRYVVLTRKSKVVEMDVMAKRPRTSAGIGVGSTAGEVFGEYGGQMSDPQEWGYGQWATFVYDDVGGTRRWLGFLFGKAFVEDGPLMNMDKVTLMGVRKGGKPGLMLDGC